MNKPEFKKGELVEYTDEYQQDYTIGDPNLARYGVVSEDTGGRLVMIEDDNGFKEVPSENIVAQGWAGWIPEHIEDIWEKYHQEEPFDMDSEYNFL